MSFFMLDSDRSFYYVSLGKIGFLRKDNFLIQADAPLKLAYVFVLLIIDEGLAFARALWVPWGQATQNQGDSVRDLAPPPALVFPGERDSVGQDAGILMRGTVSTKASWRGFLESNIY